MIKNFKWLFLVGLTIAACSSDDDASEPVDVVITPGSADFSKYVALGNSLTAGFSDNALFIKGQENSFPKLMSEQFALAGGGEFRVPYMNDNIGGLLLGGTPIQGPRLIFNGVAPVPLPGGVPTTEVTNFLSGSFNNMGIPGAKSYHLLASGYGNVAGVAMGQANPYFVRFASSSSTTVIADAVAQNPTFFSLWIGNNDVLGYATSGGSGTNQTGNLNPATYAGNDISDPTVVANVIETLVNALTANDAKGVLANIPYVSSIPFFTTVPYNPVPMDAATANAVNQAYAPYNAGLLQAEGFGLISADERARRTIAFQEGNSNAVVMNDEYLTDLTGLGLPSIRQATNEDLIVLTARTIIGTTVGGNPQLINGITVPLADNWVLSKDEIQELKTATDAYNVAIKAIADARGLAFVDANLLLRQLAAGGIRFENYHMTAAFVQGGAFSLDGVHLTARANAYIANQFLAAINTTYGSNFPPKRMADYQIHYPANLN